MISMKRGREIILEIERIVEVEFLCWIRPE